METDIGEIDDKDALLALDVVVNTLAHDLSDKQQQLCL